MARTRLILVVFLVVGLFGCKQAAQKERANALIKEAHGLAQQSTKLTEDWTREYQTAFTVENRAKFPGNRDSLRAHADKIISILDKSSNLERGAAQKYDEAGTLLTDEKDRKAVTLIASALRRSLEVNELLKSQMLLVSDEGIKDDKTLSARILQSWEVIKQKQREGEVELKEGKRLLGI